MLPKLPTLTSVYRSISFRLTSKADLDSDRYTNGLLAFHCDARNVPLPWMSRGRPGAWNVIVLMNAVRSADTRLVPQRSLSFKR